MANSSEAANNITVGQGSITVATNFWVTVEVSQWSTEGLAQFLRSPQPIKTCQHGAADFLPAQFWTPPKSEKETQLWCALYAWHYSFWALLSVHDCNHYFKSWLEIEKVEEKQRKSRKNWGKAGKEKIPTISFQSIQYTQLSDLYMLEIYISASWTMPVFILNIGLNSNNMNLTCQ